MDEQLTNQEALPNDMEEVQTTENDIPTDTASETESKEATAKSKLTKKKLAIIAAGVVAVIALTVIFLIPSEFERVSDECLQIAGRITRDDDFFKLDTYPDFYKDTDYSWMYELSGTQEKVLEAIRYANDELGFNGSVYSQMLNTTALMGRQSAETDKYRVSWTYHPDDGLEVTYEKK